MYRPRIASRAKWLVARKELLAKATPLGRQEGNDRTQGWIRHRDRYAA
jgi:predicted dithiol-disulfide oxidoreductase (DUF899 family)